MDKEIILASKSLRRQELLSLIGIKFLICGTDFDEDSIKFDGNIENYVISIAEGKCFSAVKKYPNRIVLGADTIVYADNEIMGKPKNKDEAFKFLKKLSNKTHKVITGLCLYNGITKDKITDSCITNVFVQELSDDEIWWYINSDNVLDAAGAYRIQNGFSRYIVSIEGSYHNIVGLPVNNVYNCLKKILSQ